MPVRLVYLYGSWPHLVRAADDALARAKHAFVSLGDGLRDDCAAIAHELRAHAKPIAIALLFVSPIVITLAAGALHDYGLRLRIAREGCPFADDADLHRLPGAREREMHQRYCSRATSDRG